MTRYLIIGAIAGAATPLLLLLTIQASRWLELQSVVLHLLLERATVGLWPSSLMLMGAGSIIEPDTAIILAISVAANAILYCVIAYGVWLGVNKSRVAFLVVAVLVILIWMRLFSI